MTIRRWSINVSDVEYDESSTLFSSVSGHDNSVVNHAFGEIFPHPNEMHSLVIHNIFDNYYESAFKMFDLHTRSDLLNIFCVFT